MRKATDVDAVWTAVGFGNEVADEVGVDEVAERMKFVGVETAFRHFLSHKPAWRDERVGSGFESATVPIFCFNPTGNAACEAAFHATMSHDVSLAFGDASFADSVSVQAGVGRAEQLIVVERPDRFESASFRHFDDSRREI